MRASRILIVAAIAWLVAWLPPAAAAQPEPPQLPVQVTCTVTSQSAYANGDAKLTIRCPPSQIAKESVLQAGLVAPNTALGYPLSDLARVRGAAARVKQALKAGRVLVEVGYASSAPVTMTAAQRDAIVRASEPILGGPGDVGIFAAAMNMCDIAATDPELMALVEPVRQWATRWTDAMKGAQHDGLHRLGSLLQTVLEPVR